jgi:selenocysteine lyase/cysteine desulfurase
MSAQEALAQIRRSEIGRGASIDTPFGRRLLCYADLTASGRFLDFIETWLARLRPYYANSHTAISTTGSLMTRLREEARDVVRRSVHAGPDDVVLFCGAGATACVNKLVGLLGLGRPPAEWTGFRPEDLPRTRRPLVLVGPYEHHSNELPWAESIAEVIEIAETPRGEVDLDDLDARLRAAVDEKRPLIVGSFSAASNVTGVITDVAAIARILHRHGALACFDFAASAPYAPIDMHPAGDEAAAMDAVFISTHKFSGGPQGSGVLVAHRRCFRRDVPERPGGGTVEYVSHFGALQIDYTRRLEEREEGGTPSIIGDLRAGAAFLVREQMEPRALIRHETELARRAVERLARHPRIRVLGPRPSELPRLAIVSFVIDGLHHDFVSVLLDHLFGIQNRAGCACAGPYGHRLLAIGPDRSHAYREQILRGVLGIKPGWSRLTIPAYASEAEVDFILSAVELVADHGDAFLAMYELGWRDGVWYPIGWTPPPAPFAISVESLRAATSAERGITDDELAAARAGYLAEAHALAARLRTEHAELLARPSPRTGDPVLDELVWFRWIHARPLPPAHESLPPPLASD